MSATFSVITRNAYSKFSDFTKSRTETVIIFEMTEYFSDFTKQH